ncbi:AraC family transcriptional regulator [Litoreibacter meonggei]|uniref:AraC family transcriptional regulator n=1 Tax=Litoreibacter meonggei TaxID=1049199 RepID=A0A497X5G5_9RHOB|nr:AraC family transcriptional regulator [Litoreibacter meonggei]RLJ60517.1 AraC family transcriptional regulator [Litoreibacter meonggei]
MGKQTERFWLNPELETKTPALLAHSSLDGLLRFEYREDEPGSLPPQVHAHNSLIISVQDTPIRVIADRDGRTERFTMEAGHIAVALAGSLTAWQWLDPAKVIIIHVNPTVMRRFVQTELKVVPNGHRFENTIFFHDADVRHAAERMKDTLEADELGSSVVFDALARMFLVLMVKRYCKKDHTDAAFDQRFGPEQYAQVVTFVEDHLAEKINPAQLASELGMSEAAFSRKFKATVGETPMRFVTQVRLEVASRLLGEGVQSLAQIAAQCGFADQAHLSRSFKQHLGVSPSQFRADQVHA